MSWVLSLIDSEINELEGLSAQKLFAPSFYLNFEYFTASHTISSATKYLEDNLQHIFKTNLEASTLAVLIASSKS